MSDYIERETIEKMLENASMISDGEYSGYCTEDVCLEDIPSSDVEPVKHESWNRVEVSRDGCLHVLYVCSGCSDYIGMKKENDIGIWTIRDNYCYCRKCGAKMDAED